ncbi:MAG TPA: pyrroloquinoline quinone-dependent dehydrogenase [Acidobacteria bacterium]|nr:pyrroloquinoline quinone-dependent dehydrogenase [Acidobacteriota bacterium]
MAQPVFRAVLIGVATAAIGLTAVTAPGRASAQTVEWPAYAADQAGTKYLPLDQINADTVHDLEIVWRQPVIPDAIRNGVTTRGPVGSQTTPLMAGGLLYFSTGLGTIAALAPTTGEVVWNTGPSDDERVRQTRGVAHWTDGNEQRIVATLGPKLVSLDARTGERDPEFGEAGEVDLRLGLMRPFPNFYWNAAPIIVRDVIIIGSFVEDITSNQLTANKESPRGDVRGYDVRTGELVWTFHTIPRENEFGVETWGADPVDDRASWEYSGNTNMWAHPTGDEELGIVYLPLSTPTNDYYGGHRPGDNLFAESLVAVDVETGERLWHFQAIHHGVWDYDFASSAVLMDITVDGRVIKAVAQPSKQAFVYVFDRSTGDPVWPIEERPVAASDVPGERLSPTQPFPTKPPAFELQGVRVDDLIDFTPELRAEAIELLDQYAWGPMFTAPVVLDPRPGGKKGTIFSPGTAGGASWSGAGVDPETGILYVPSAYSQNVAALVPSEHPRADVRLVREKYTPLQGPQGLPMFKPPYGRLTAIDLNQGDIAWQVPNGEGPRDHPAIQDLDLPWLGQPGRASVLITSSLVFLGEGGNTGVSALPQWYGGPGGKMFRAYDKASGEVVWEMELPGGTSGAPMTYMLDGRQYIIATVGWNDMASELVALALPD